jgi:hypothetical protein
MYFVNQIRKQPMKIFKTPKLIALLTVVLFFAGLTVHAQDGYKFVPESRELYARIVQMDSVLFTAYNNCDMETQARIFSDNLEFYHDKGGLITSKKDLLDAIKKNICGKVTRVLVPGSIEVYPIAGYGAVEIGLHRFINHQENNNLSKPDKFICVWQQKGDSWQVTRVISLH